MPMPKQGVRKSLETSALSPQEADIARLIVDEFHAVAVTVEVRKFVLPETDYVAARCRLER